MIKPSLKGRDIYLVMQKVFRFIKGFGIPAIALLISPIGVFAVGITGPKGANAPNNVFSNVSDITLTTCTVVDWLFYGLIVLAVIMVLLAAYGYLTSGGDPEKTKSASHKLLYAAIAIVVGLIAVGFPQLISSFFGNSAFTANVFSC